MRPQLRDALALLRTGDPQKVGEAISLLQGTVYAFSMKVCGHREDAEDTMQDVLMRSLPHLAKIEDPRALAVWLYTVTRNRCWRSRHKGAYDPAETLSLDALMPDGTELQWLLADKGAGPEERVALTEENQVLHKAVLSLPAQYRMVLVLHDMEDLDTEQVAKVLGLKAGTVRVRLHRARLGVRKVMSELLHGATAFSLSRATPSKRKHPRPSVKVHLGQPTECREIFANLSEYLDGRLQATTCADMKKHIEACPACIAFIRDLNSAIERCRTFQTDCDSDIPARLTALVAREYLRLIGQAV